MSSPDLLEQSLRVNRFGTDRVLHSVGRLAVRVFFVMATGGSVSAAHFFGEFPRGHHRPDWSLGSIS